MVSIKRATIEDVDAVLKLSRKLFRELGHQFPTFDNNQSISFWQMQMGSGQAK